MRVWLEPGHGQGAAIAVAALEGIRQLDELHGLAADARRTASARSPFRQTLELQQDAGRWLVARVRGPGEAAVAADARDEAAAAAGASPACSSTDVAPQVGLDFRQGAFRYGVTADVPAMMGGGLCWLDYDNDGWLDLFVVNSYADGDIGA